MKKITCTISSAIALLGVTSITIADNPPPIAACKNYLRYSDSQFDSWLSSNRKQAKTVSTQLASCLHANSCSIIGDIDNCAATLASRTFLSTFYANYSSNLSIPNAFPGGRRGFSRIGDVHSTPSAAKITTTTQSVINSPTTQAPVKNTDKTSGSSINWY